MALVDERDIENRIEELEREIQQERIENKRSNRVSRITTIISAIFTLIVNTPTLVGLYHQYLVFPTERDFEVFMNDYGKAYSEVVNNYIQGDNDFSKLDKYIVNNDSGNEFKKKIISNIENHIEKSDFKKDTIYEYNFNYRDYKSFEETKCGDFILISGVDEIYKNKSDGKIKNYKPNGDGIRFYKISIDKSTIKIAIENRVNDIGEG